MGENSKIEWCDATMNPWVGCTKVSPGCDNCYAEAMMDKRWGKVKWGPHGERRRTGDENWRKPLRWAKTARGAGKRPRVFCASLADVFDNQVPPKWRADLFELIRATPELDWLLLTKRPQNIKRMLPPVDWHNIWLGTTCEDQQRMRERYIALTDVKNVAKHFISYEPAIGPLELPIPPIDWIICGGESGPKARQMDLQWARDLRDYCAEWNIPFFFKQTTGKKPIPPDLMVRQFPNS